MGVIGSRLAVHGVADYLEEAMAAISNGLFTSISTFVYSASHAPSPPRPCCCGSLLAVALLRTSALPPPCVTALLHCSRISCLQLASSEISGAVGSVLLPACDACVRAAAVEVVVLSDASACGVA
eukprot:5895900-Pleurochrysis_carterae.AAC.1